MTGRNASVASGEGTTLGIRRTVRETSLGLLDKNAAQPSLNENAAQRTASEIINQNYWSARRLLGYSLWTWWALLLMIAFGTGGWAFPDGSNPSCDAGEPDLNKSMCGMISAMQKGR